VLEQKYFENASFRGVFLSLSLGHRLLNTPDPQVTVKNYNRKEEEENK